MRFRLFIVQFLGYLFRRGIAPGADLRGGFPGIVGARSTEVDEHRLALGGDEDVRGLYVPVYDVVRMKVRKSPKHTGQEYAQLALRHGGATLIAGSHISALDEGHHDVGSVVLLEHREHPHNVRVVRQVNQGDGLLHKAFFRPVIELFIIWIGNYGQAVLGAALYVIFLVILWVVFLNHHPSAGEFFRRQICDTESPLTDGSLQNIVLQPCSGRQGIFNLCGIRIDYDCVGLHDGGR